MTGADRKKRERKREKEYEKRTERVLERIIEIVQKKFGSKLIVFYYQKNILFTVNANDRDCSNTFITRTSCSLCKFHTTSSILIHTIHSHDLDQKYIVRL